MRSQHTQIAYTSLAAIEANDASGKEEDGVMKYFTLKMTAHYQSFFPVMEISRKSELTLAASHSTRLLL